MAMLAVIAICKQGNGVAPIHVAACKFAAVVRLAVAVSRLCAYFRIFGIHLMVDIHFLGIYKLQCPKVGLPRSN